MLDELTELLNRLLEKDEAFHELIADEELFKEENELLAIIIDWLLETLDELFSDAMLEAMLELLRLANELEATRDKLLKELLLEMPTELDFEELLAGLEDEVGVGFCPALLAAGALLPPPPPPQAVKIRERVRAEAIPPKRAFEFFITFLCCRSDIWLVIAIFVSIYIFISIRL